MKYTNSMLSVRAILAVLLTHLILGDSIWVSVDGDATLPCSLCNLLGFKTTHDYHAFLVAGGLAVYSNFKGGRRLELQKNEFHHFFKQHGFKSDLIELDKKQFKVDSHKFTFKVMRIGVKGERSAPSFADQMRIACTDLVDLDQDKWNHVAMEVQSYTKQEERKLRQEKRVFIRAVRPFIASIMVEDEDMFRDSTSFYKVVDKKEANNVGEKQAEEKCREEMDEKQRELNIIYTQLTFMRSLDSTSNRVFPWSGLRGQPA